MISRFLAFLVYSEGSPKECGLHDRIGMPAMLANTICDLVPRH